MPDAPDPNPWLPPLAGDPPDAPPSPRVDGHDYTVYADVARRLRATRRFDRVYLGARPADVPQDHNRHAAILPLDGEDIDDAGGEDDVEMVRRARFLIEVTSNLPDLEARYRELSRLMSAAKNAVNGQSLAGLTIAALTLIRRDRFLDRRTHPSGTMTLEGEWSMELPGYGGFDERAGVD